MDPDEAAISLMALSCVNQTVENLRKTEKIVSYIRGQRQHDGSYGALYSTALVLQVRKGLLSLLPCVCVYVRACVRVYVCVCVDRWLSSDD